MLQPPAAVRHILPTPLLKEDEFDECRTGRPGWLQTKYCKDFILQEPRASSLLFLLSLVVPVAVFFSLLVAVLVAVLLSLVAVLVAVLLSLVAVAVAVLLSVAVVPVAVLVRSA
jgi:hypothetical protein